MKGGDLKSWTKVWVVVKREKLEAWKSQKVLYLRSLHNEFT
jgi:hypothetical protein